MKLKHRLPQVGSSIYSFRIENELIICDFENQPVDFVLLNNGELRIGKGHYRLSGKSGDLFFAGKLMIEKGKIIYIDNDSGHYEPNALDLGRCVEFLQTKKLMGVFFETKVIDF